jgi:hypothetical protein
MGWFTGGCRTLMTYDVPSDAAGLDLDPDLDQTSPVREDSPEPRAEVPPVQVHSFEHLNFGHRRGGARCW